MNSYNVWAQFYDDLMDFDYPALCDYYESVFEKYNCHPHTVLDLACGTGKVSAELAKRGYDITGIDLNENMLAQAQFNLADYPETLLLHQDMRELDLNDTVDSVVCALDGFNHLSDTRSFVSALQRAALFLNRNGLLIFDLISEGKFFKVLSDNVSVFDLDRLYCVWQSELSGKRTIRHTLDFFISNKNDRYRRDSEYFSEYWFSPTTVKNALKKAGLTLLEINTKDPMRTFYIAGKG
ncbi:MAG TPA: class I SAM-dependent methyltransferase [Oscillospiraceae bacterium]|nr:class I SAM-dependent methyltransferase [Oscillospiraceae bacterium]HPK34213.1 class I SAM-dependent methyltransferase [Oscillospiraceae bacterium]HPR74884.1 class I SAM-dependent methyltransferase [Oscillospiraceae bacterium]